MKLEWSNQGETQCEVSLKVIEGETAMKLEWSNQCVTLCARSSEST